MTYKHYPNTQDGNHCVQACIQTVVDHFGMEVPTLRRLDIITGHKPGMYTWLTDALLWLSSKKFRILHIENLDYERFASEGASYLKEIYSKEVFELQERMSDLRREQRAAKLLTKYKEIQLIRSTMPVQIIKPMLDSGYACMASVNPFTLDGNEGSASHLVVVCEVHMSGEDIKSFKICDPDHGFRVIPAKRFSEALKKDDFSVTFLKK